MKIDYAEMKKRVAYRSHFVPGMEEMEYRDVALDQ